VGLQPLVAPLKLLRVLSIQWWVVLRYYFSTGTVGTFFEKSRSTFDNFETEKPC